MIANADDVGVTAVEYTPGELTITWQDSFYSVYSALWLRDNDPVHRDARTGERLISLLDLPREPRLKAAEPQPPGHLTLNWEDGATSVFSLSWLRAYDRSLRIGSRPTRMPWMGQPATAFASTSAQSILKFHFSPLFIKNSLENLWTINAGLNLI